MNTIVRDEVLVPYHCSRDKHGWTIFEDVVSQESKKTYVRPICHPSTFTLCLKKIAELKTNNGQFDSIKEYINKYTTEHDRISKEFKVNI